MTARRSFVVGLIGVLVGALLVGGAPALAKVGDVLTLGSVNKGGSETTTLSAKVADGPALKVINTGGDSKAAVRINTDGFAPPFATNSQRRVLNFNADKLDDREAQELHVLHEFATIADAADANGIVLQVAIETPVAGMLVIDGIVEVVFPDDDALECTMWVDNQEVPRTRHSLGAQGSIFTAAPCTTAGSVAVGPGFHWVDLRVSYLTSARLDAGSVRATFLPD